MSSLPGVSHSPAPSLYCVLELDNTRLQTQAVGRSTSPVWNKEFQVEVRDITSCLLVSLLDRDRGMKTNLLGRLSLPLLRLGSSNTTSSRSFVLKDKHLRGQAKGGNMAPSVELEWSLQWDAVKAALVSLCPREEVLMNQNREKFKRKKFSDNVARLKSLYSQLEQAVVVASQSVHWESR